MLFFILLFIISISVNIGFYNKYDIYFGKDDIINYQRLIYEPDLFHINTYIINYIFGEYLFFNIIMPFIIFICLPLSINYFIRDYNKTKFIMLSSGLFFFYWIVGLYSQCIAHIFYNIYLGNKKKLYLFISIINHPTVLLTHGLIKGKYLLIGLSIIIVYIIYPNDLINYTVFRLNQNLLGMFIILMNPILFFKKNRIDLNHYIGLLSSNMRITFYTIPQKLNIDKYKQYYLSSIIWFIIIFILHYYMMIDNRF